MHIMLHIARSYVDDYVIAILKYVNFLTAYTIYGLWNTTIRLDYCVNN